MVVVVVCCAMGRKLFDGNHHVSGELNGHAYVDLGLPSGILWATCNVGADTPEGYGEYFAWGETQTKDIYTWDSYKFYDSTGLTKYTKSDSLTLLQPGDDAATVNWGEEWRMPTSKDWRELYKYTTCEWVARDTVSGMLFTASNGNVLFLPAAGDYSILSLVRPGELGQYWSKSLVASDPGYAWSFSFYLHDYGMSQYYRRFNGRSIRPVCSTTVE